MYLPLNGLVHWFFYAPLCLLHILFFMPHSSKKQLLVFTHKKDSIVFFFVFCCSWLSSTFVPGNYAAVTPATPTIQGLLTACLDIVWFFKWCECMGQLLLGQIVFLPKYFRCVSGLSTPGHSIWAHQIKHTSFLVFAGSRSHNAFICMEQTERKQCPQNIWWLLK